MDNNAILYINVAGTSYPIGVNATNISGTIPAANLPSYVDDVIEGYYYNSKFYKEAEHTTLITGETGKIYVDLTKDGLVYRWSGSTYIPIVSGGINDASLTVSFGGGSYSFSANQSTNVTTTMSAFNVVSPTSASTANATANNGSVRLNSVNDLGGSKKAVSSTLISGKGATTVTADASGNIIINSTDTNTKVTSAANHYTPTTDAGSALSKTASGSTTSAVFGTTNIVTGVGIQRDSKGHVTDITLTSVKMPANPNTDTHHISNNVFASTSTAKTNASAANGSVYLNHIENDTVRSYHNIKGTGITTVTADASGNITINTPNTNTDTKVTSAANHYDPTTETESSFSATASGSTTSASFGTTNIVTGVTIKKDPRGHVTGVTVTSVKMPTNPNNHYTSKNIVASSSTATSNTTASITTNGNVWLNHLEESAVKSAHNIKGSGATTVTADASGNIIINSTDTKGLNVVSSTSGATSNTTAALTNGNVYLNHVEGGAVKSYHKMTGTNSITVTTDASGNILINHPSHTAATYGATTASTPGFGETFAVPYTTVNSYGHVTEGGTRNVTIPKPTYDASSRTLKF